MSWICDVCRQEIETVQNGWVEWITFQEDGGRYRGRNFRLVHHRPASPIGRCQFVESRDCVRGREFVSDRALPDFLGRDGLMRLLAMIADERMPRDEVLEMIKRLHIEGYEHARLHFEEAIEHDVFELNTSPGYHYGYQIDAVLDWASSRD